MCDSYNDLDCPITMSTIGTPDATFVAQKVGDDLQFRGIALGGGMIGTLSPDLLIIDTSTPGNPIPVDGVIGTLDEINYLLISPVQWPLENTYTLASASYNTGMFAGNTLIIPVETYYKVCFNPVSVTQLAVNGATITYRIRNSVGDIYAEFYARSLSDNENTSTFCHVMLLPADTYTFSIQVTDLSPAEYVNFVASANNFSVKRVSL
jgi:hypothetical protein